jgi:predicted permease
MKIMPEKLLQDLSYGARMLRKNPGFTTVAVLILALGIGANTAIFSILDPLLLRSLPVSRPDELVRVDAAGSMRDVGAWENIAYARLREPSRVFSGVLAFVPASLNDVVLNGRSGSAESEIISENFFSVLGVQPFVGKLIFQKEELGNVVVLGFDYWQREFNGDNAALGKTILVQGTQRTVVGITQPGFFGMRVGEAADFYLPTATTSGERNNLALDWVMVIGRLAPGVTSAQAFSALQPVFSQIKAESNIPAIEQAQDMDHLVLTSAARGLSSLRYRFSLPARILMCVVGLVLLIACFNVANLLLAQGAARRREITVRIALGAARMRVVRQLLTESAILGVTGAVSGLLLANWCSRLLVAALSDFQTHVVLAANLNMRVLSFSLAMTVLAVLLCGLAPAISATRVNLSHDIKPYGEARNSARAKLGSWLLAGQVALAVTVLVSSGLLLHSLVKLETMDVGFDRSHIIAIDLNGGAKARTPQQVQKFYEQLLERANALPGVRSATLSNFAPLSGEEMGINVKAEGASEPSGKDSHVFLLGVRPGYFSTLGIDLLQGSDFSLQSSSSTQQLAIINHSLARHYFGDQNPVGKRLQTIEGNHMLQIIGVVADSKYNNLREDATDFLYLSSFTRAFTIMANQSTLSVRAAANVAALRDELSALIHSLDASVHISRIATLRERIDDSLHYDRLIAALCGIFGLLALTLTCVGLYGVLSFNVARRTSEIGIRMALGAGPRNIVRLFVGGGMRLVMAGLAAGLVLSVASTSLLKSMLFGIGRGDPITYIGIPLLLIVSSLLACYLPARRATRVDPLEALRTE